MAALVAFASVTLLFSRIVIQIDSQTATTQLYAGNILKDCLVDAAFVIDESESIRRLNWPLVIDFVKNVSMLLNIGQNATHVAAVSFSTTARVNFNLSRGTSADEVLAAFSQIKYVSSGGTNATEGLRTTRQSIFRSQYGDRPNVPNVLILVTDEDAENELNALTAEANTTKNAGITIIAVVVQSTETGLESIVSPPQDDNYVRVTDFSGLDYVVSQIANSSCEASVCPAEDSHNMLWPRTPIGHSVNQPCPGNSTGMCSRNCNNSETGKPIWSMPDCNLCVSNVLKEIVEEIKNLGNGSGLNNSEEFDKVSRSLSDFTNRTLRTEPLTSAELGYSIGAVGQLAQLRNDSSMPRPTEDEIKSVIGTISNLVEPNNSLSWDLIRKTDDVAAATLMLSADVYGQTMDETVVTEYVVAEANVWETGKLPAEVTFPSKKIPGWAESGIDRISVPISELASGQRSSVHVWSFYYKNIGDFLPSGLSDAQVDSRVLSVSIGGDIPGQRLKKPVEMTLQHNTTDRQTHSRYCVFWKFQPDNELRGMWSDDGCRVTSSDSRQTNCSCDHLTNFALLVSRNPSGDVVLSVISTVGCSISVAALLITVIVHVAAWKGYKQSKSQQTVVLLNLCVALITANMIFLLGAGKVADKAACAAVAALLHYFFLVAFFVMLIEGIQLLVYVVCVFRAKQTIETVGLIAGAWGLPLIIVAISLGVNKTEGYGTKTACWLSFHNHTIWAFLGPAFFIVAINVVIVIIVLRRIATRPGSSKKEGQTKIRETIRNIAVMCPVFGITWLFGALSVSFDHIVFQYIFAIANSLQGLFIFIFHARVDSKAFVERVTKLFRRSKVDFRGRARRESRHRKERMDLVIEELQSTNITETTTTTTTASSSSAAAAAGASISTTSATPLSSASVAAEVYDAQQRIGQLDHAQDAYKFRHLERPLR